MSIYFPVCIVSFRRIFYPSCVLTTSSRFFTLSKCFKCNDIKLFPMKVYLFFFSIFNFSFFRISVDVKNYSYPLGVTLKRRISISLINNAETGLSCYQAGKCMNTTTIYICIHHLQFLSTRNKYKLYIHVTDHWTITNSF